MRVARTIVKIKLFQIRSLFVNLRHCLRTKLEQKKARSFMNKYTHASPTRTHSKS